MSGKRRTREMTEQPVKLTPDYWRLVHVAVDRYLADEPSDLDALDRERLEIACRRIGDAAGPTR